MKVEILPSANCTVVMDDGYFVHLLSDRLVTIMKND